MKVKTHKFSRGVFRINEDPLHGICTEKPNEIWINPELRGLKRLETIIHEAEHAEDPEAKEEVIHRRAHHIARLLWRMGYRAKK